jgi:hypothetical protein
MPDQIETVVITVGIQGPPGPPGSGGGGGGASFEMIFDHSFLSIASVLIVNHGLGNAPSGITVYNASGEGVIPDRIEVASPDMIAVHLQSFAPLQGVWKISITT